MPNGIVLSPVEHDGVGYAVGDELEADAKTLATLAAVGAVQLPGDAAEADPAEPPAGDPPAGAGRRARGR